MSTDVMRDQDQQIAALRKQAHKIDEFKRHTKKLSFDEISYNTAGSTYLPQVRVSPTKEHQPPVTHAVLSFRCCSGP